MKHFIFLLLLILQACVSKEEWFPKIQFPLNNESLPKQPGDKIKVWGTFELKVTGNRKPLTREEERELRIRWEEYKKNKPSGTWKEFKAWVVGKPKLDGVMTCNGIQGTIHAVEGAEGWEVENLPLVTGDNTITCEYKAKEYSHKSVVKVKYVPTNLAPVARIVATPESGQAPLTVFLDGEQSSDPDGKVETFYWEFPGGIIATTSRVKYQFKNPGNYRVFLTVYDELGARNTTSILILAQDDTTPPQIAFKDEDGAVFSTTIPLIEIDYSDEEENLDLKSFRLILDGVDITSRVVLTDTKALLQFTMDFPLPRGEHVFTATISDGSQNQNQDEVTYYVDDGQVTESAVFVGRVVTKDDQPIAGAVAEVKTAPVTRTFKAISDADGYYRLPFQSSGIYLLKISKPGFISSLKEAEGVEGRDGTVPEAVLMPADPKVTSLGTSGGVASNSSGSVVIEVPAGAITTDIPFAMTEANFGRGLTIPLPPLTEFTYAIDHQPSGTQFLTPVTIRQKNDLGFAPGTKIALGVTDDELGIWKDAGYPAVVSADGKEIVYPLSHFSSSDSNNGGSSSTAITPDTVKDVTQDGGGPNPCGVSYSIINVSSCSLGTSIKLPTVKRLERDLELELMYTSTYALPSVVLESLNFQDHPQRGLPKLMDVRFDIVGTILKSLHDPQTNIAPSYYRSMAEPKTARGEFVSNGSYAYRHEASASYDDGKYAETEYFGAPGGDTLGVPMRENILVKNGFDDRTVIRNEIDSPYGAGWTLVGQDHLFIDPEGTVVKGEGISKGQIFYPIEEASGSEIRLAQEEYTDVLSFQGFIYASSCKANAVYRLTLAGEATQIADLPCPGRMTPSKKGGIYVVTDGGSSITFLPLKSKIGIRVVHTSRDTDPITALYEDSVLALHFTQGDWVRTVSPKDGSVINTIGKSGLIKTNLKGPMDILMDRYGSFVVLDSGNNRILHVFPKTKMVRTIVGGTRLKSKYKREILANEPELDHPVRLSADAKLKRFFILESNGRILHWKGVGSDRLAQIGQDEAGLVHVRGKHLPEGKRSSIVALTYSPEIGLVTVDDRGLRMRTLDHQGRRAGMTRYISPVGNFTQLAKLENGLFEQVYPDKTVHTYSGDGFLKEKREIDGKTTTYVYEGKRLTKLITIAGDFYQFEYNANGKLAAIIDPAGRTTQFTVNAKGDLIQVRYSDSTLMQYGYDNLHLLTSEIDQEGKTTSYVYEKGRIVKEIEPGGREIQFEPLSLVGLARKKNEITPRVSPEQLVTKIISPEGRERSIKVGAEGVAVGMVKGTLKPSHVTTDANALPVREISPEGRVVAKNYDALGRVTSLQDKNGRTFLTYDVATGKIATLSPGSGLPEVYTYDGQGRLSRKVDRMGNPTVYTYHDSGVLKTMRNAVNDFYQFNIDDHGNMTSWSDTLGQITEMELDEAGQMMALKDRRGNITTYERDSWNRVTKITSPINGMTRFTYSPKGLLTSVTDAKNQTTSYTYNDQDLVATETNPVGQIRHFSYDDDGLLVQETTWSGQIIQYQYDEQARLVSKTSADDELFYEYDDDNLLVRVTNRDSEVVQDYDQLGRLILSWQKGISALPVTYGYALDGTLSATRFGSRIEEIYAVNVNDVMISTNFSNFGFTDVWSVNRDPLNRPGTVFAPNGESKVMTFGEDNKLKAIDYNGNFKLDYSYDENANIISMVEQSVAGAKSSSYVYDDEDRLSQVDGPSPESFLMDLMGNILNGGAVFDSRNQLVENQDWFYEYDLNGNLSKKTAKLSPKVIEYDFDLENRLREVRISEGATWSKLNFKYDGFGRRIERRLEKSAKGLDVTQYVYSGDDILLEQSGSGQLLRNYLRSDSIDGLWGVLEDVDCDGRVATNEEFYFRTDHLGSVREVTNRAKEVIQRYDYSAYGVPTKTVMAGKTEVELTRMFTGREFEPETGDYYYRARWYDPSTGRFLSEDPIGFRGRDFNLYRYVANNPILFIDPKGQDKTVAAIIAVGVGLAIYFWGIDWLIETALSSEGGVGQAPAPSCNPSLQSCQPSPIQCI